MDFNNNTGYIEVKDGKVRMLEMSKEICPNSICSDTGWIDKIYQSIVCLPNNIIVTIEGVEEETIDAQSF
ncbi:NusG domain II-containing protein [Clostridium intestinale]|uniref:NusG domain II-containing protein n=1 Tax=Clostridium intestinale TaxID=36845 RepID=UPI001FA75E76|nr:NusG domain II-containing protein [Clostridium intestinale]